MKNYKKSNIKLYNVALLCLAFFILFTLQARAATIEKTEIDSNKKIEINGSCKDGVLNVQIFSATSSRPFYTAGADCKENKFEFKDDLGYWKFPDGDYSIAVVGKNDNLNNSSAVTFKIQSAAPPTAEENIVEPAVDLENSSVVVQENDAVSDQSVILASQPDGLFAQIINFLVEWFKNAVVMIKELVVEKVTTPELCLGTTCIIEDQLKDLLGEKQKIEASAPEPEIQPPMPSSASETPPSIPPLLGEGQEMGI